MWFKNLRIYCLTEELPCLPEELEGKLQDTRFVACGSLDTSRIGWVPPMGATLMGATLRIVALLAPVH